MRKLPLLMPFLFLCCSCATILNSKKTSIRIDTDREALLVVHSDTVQTRHNSVTVPVLRGGEPLTIKALSDSDHVDFTVHPRNSMAFWLNIFTNYGIGMLVDKDNPKRFAYPPEIYLKLKDPTYSLSRFVPSKQGKTYIVLSLPHVNSFLFKPDNVSKVRVNTGFFGLSVGMDHYYKQNKFLRLTIGAVANLPIPVPAPYDYSGPRENMSSEYLNISINYQLNRFLLGYGVTVARNSWRWFNTYTTPTVYYGSQDNVEAGIVVQSYYRLGRSFYVGAIYRPTFFRFSSDHFLQYDHVISLDLSWRLNL